MTDKTAETTARTLYAGWIAQFGVPDVVTTDQGRQFEPNLFRPLSSLLGVKRIRTTAYNPAANGAIECFHRSIKSSIMCHDSTSLYSILPTVLLGCRPVLKREMRASPAELVYGTTIRLPGEFVSASEGPVVDAEGFVNQLRQGMDRLRPTAVRRHGRRQTFVHKELRTC